MTRLYPAYARDVLSFLDYAQLQECRLVSRSTNCTIVNCPASISARRCLSWMHLTVGNTETFQSPQVGTDGYVDMLVASDYKPWKEVQRKWACCRCELEVSALIMARWACEQLFPSDRCWRSHLVQELAQTFIGKRILLSHPAESLVEFSIKPDRKSSIILSARNEMTAETAFGVLHLLEHLSDVYISRHFSAVDIGYLDSDSTALNPSLLRLLSDDRNGRKLYVNLYQRMSNTVNTLFADVAHLKIQELRWEGSSYLEMALNFAVRGRPYCRRITFDLPANSAFDAVLQYFHTTIRRISRDMVLELVLRRYHRNYLIDGFLIDFWPTGVPPMDELESVGYDRVSGGSLHRLRGGMTNFNSGERFEVIVLCEWIDVGATKMKTLAEMRLLFGQTL